MATEFRYAARSSRSGQRRLLAATALVIVLVILDLLSGGKVRSVLRDAAGLIWGAGSHVELAISRSGYFSSRRSLENQISALQEELQEAHTQAAAFSVVEAQNQELSVITHLAASSPGVTAPLASSLIASPYGTFLIGAGSGDGITAGELVETSGGFVVGTISDVQAHTSLVQESFAPNATIDVVIDGASVQAKGQGGGEAIAQIPRTILVSANDPVTAPQFKNKPVGVAEHVNADPASAVSTVLIALPTSLSSLEYVYVTP